MKYFHFSAISLISADLLDSSGISCDAVARKKNKGEKKGTKITGGWPVNNIENWPFIGHTDECGMVYIGRNAGLTAAHCCGYMHKP